MGLVHNGLGQAQEIKLSRGVIGVIDLRVRCERSVEGEMLVTLVIPILIRCKSCLVVRVGPCLDSGVGRVELDYKERSWEELGKKVGLLLHQLEISVGVNQLPQKVRDKLHIFFLKNPNYCP